MVRRQTIQIEEEKRALLRLLLIVVTLLLVASLLALAWVYQRYNRLAQATDQNALEVKRLSAELQSCRQEMEKEKRELEQKSQLEAQRRERIDLLLPKVLGQTASYTETGEFAHAVYEEPGHMIELPRMPPDEILRRYRYQLNDRVQTYVLVAGQIEGKWVLYSNLVLTSAP